MQFALPSADIALNVIVNPTPAGNGLRSAEIVELWLTSIEPDFMKVCGPAIT